MQCPEPKRRRASQAVDPLEVVANRLPLGANPSEPLLFAGLAVFRQRHPTWGESPTCPHSELTLRANPFAVPRCAESVAQQTTRPAADDNPMDPSKKGRPRVSRSEVSVGVRRRLKGKSTAPSGLLDGSAAVRRALGLSEGPGSVGRVPGMHVGNDTGAFTDCPCGWKQPLHLPSSVMQARVKTYWRVRQGQRPPTLNIDVKRLTSMLPLAEKSTSRSRWRIGC